MSISKMIKRNEILRFVLLLIAFYSQAINASRIKRADDTNQLDAVVSNLSQQVTALTTELNALKARMGKIAECIIYLHLIFQFQSINTFEL